MNPELKEYFARGVGMLAVAAFFVYFIALDASKSEKNNNVAELARAAEAEGLNEYLQSSAATVAPSEVPATPSPTPVLKTPEVRVDRNETDSLPISSKTIGIETSWIPQIGSLVYCGEMGWGEGEYLFPASVINALLDQGIIFYPPGEYVKVAEDGSADIVPKFGNSIIPTTTGQTCVFAQSKHGK